MNLDELLGQWRRRAAEARAHAAKLSDYRHRDARASYQLEASIYETCAKELEQEKASDS